MKTRDHASVTLTKKTGVSEISVDIGVSRRERQIMYALYTLGRAAGKEIQERLPDSPSYSAVRTILRILEHKGLVRRNEEQLRYIYEPTTPRHVVGKYALENLLQAFFENSSKQAIITLLNLENCRLTRSELDELSSEIENTRNKCA